MAAFEKSGKSQARFTSDAGIPLPAFRHWLYKLRAEAGARPVTTAGASTRDLRLVPVEIRDPVATGAIEVDVASLRVRVTGNASPAYLASLVGALRGLGRC